MESLDFVNGVLFPYLNFFIFLILAIVFFRKPIRGMFLTKREHFVKMRADAEAARADAERTHAQLQARMKTLAAEMDEIKALAEKEAAMESAHAIEAAKRLAEHIEEEARRVSDAEIQRARTAIKTELVDKAVSAALAEIAKKLNPEEHKKMVNHRLADLGSLKLEGAST